MDGVEEALDLLETDGRRKLATDERARVLTLWREEFRKVPSQTIKEAVLTFCREKRVGRPSLAELHAILERSKPKQARWEAERSANQRAEIAWACDVLEFPSRFQGNYWHTLDYAQRILKHYGYGHWHDAMAAINPGWSPPSTTEFIL